ncbi:recombination-associated protein RdgC [Rhizobacter sp. Root404]|uniref:recombination-associated protein RdgC n=1 Tax=Rhizobacter sp. Root404 TaxID=1736528 RepID=UPI0006FF1D82|nr:recombination-associated protein RdgC [Rhizobacter sp. Root404]KQW38312.1 exonuclease [Rhizobacter sp. Root404]
MFKNLIVYRIGPGWAANSAELEAGLEKMVFVECGATQPVSAGWAPPRGVAHAPLLESVGGQWLMKLVVEQRVVPSAVVKRRVDERAAQIEQATGRKPGKKQQKELKEEVLLDLLPQAFTKQAAIRVWLNPKDRLLMIDASSPAKADDVVTQLVKAAEGLALTPLHTAQSPAAAMSEWLTTGDAPAGFSIDRECELKSPDESKSAVRYARHALDIEEVRQHIAGGKVPTQLALTWQGRVSLLLTEAMQVKKIAFLEGVFEGGSKPKADEAFEADAAIATGELGKLIPDLIDALGGEQQPGVPALAA